VPTLTVLVLREKKEVPDVSRYFMAEIRSDVSAYFEKEGGGKKGNRQLHIRATVLICSIVLLYLSVLVGWNPCIYSEFLVAVLLSQALALLTVWVVHDASHHCFSGNPRINAIARLSTFLIGMNADLWRRKHSGSHHRFTNIYPLDDDLNSGGLLRLSPYQRRRAWHKYQHIYALLLYAGLSLYVVFYADLRRAFASTMSVGIIGRVILEKSAYIFLALVLPSVFHPWEEVLVFFIAVHVLFSIPLSLVVLLAHTVEGVEHWNSNTMGITKRDWLMHQLSSTANFSVKSRLAFFLTGGLNFQIEHHLFPSVSHVHYPAIASLLRLRCVEFGLPYVVFPTFRSAVASHFRYLATTGVEQSKNMQDNDTFAR
jgi:linoleoyl-CoA desaturase